MDRPSENVRKLEEAISDFVTSFELVFDIDWQMTKNCIADPSYLIENSGTFIHPGVDDESSNWWNRGNLLASYRHLIEVLEKHSIPHGIDYDTNPANTNF